MDTAFYNTKSWRRLRAQVRLRDLDTCVIAAMFGGECLGPLHVHHLNKNEPLNPDGLVTVCARHHPTLETLLRPLPEPAGWRRCPHRHRTSEGRRVCEARLNGVVTAA